MTWAYNDSRVKIKTGVWDRAEIYSDYNNYNRNNNDNIKIDANNYDSNSNSINIVKNVENDDKDNENDNYKSNNVIDSNKLNFIYVSGSNDINNGNNSKIMNTGVYEYNKVSKIKGVNK